MKPFVKNNGKALQERMISAKTKKGQNNTNIYVYTLIVIEIVIKKMELDKYFAHLNADSLIKCYTHDKISFL